MTIGHQMTASKNKRGIEGNIQISKIESARRQIECALTLYFHSGDAVSIHTLAAAGYNLLNDLLKHRDVKESSLWKTLLNEIVALEHHAKVSAKFRETENYFKHADRDAEKELSFAPFISEFILLDGIEVYRALTGEIPPIFEVFRRWWELQNINLLLPKFRKQLEYTLNRVPGVPMERLSFLRYMLPAILLHRSGQAHLQLIEK